MKIQSMWVGNKISKIERLSMQSFQSNGMSYTLYVYNDVKNIPDGVNIDDANKILHESEVTTYKKGPGKGSYAGFADYFRWALMYKVGGVWVDTDVICLKNFSTKKNKVAGEIIYPEHPNYLCASTQFLHFDPGHHLMKEFYELCKSKDCGDIEWGDIGPKLINDRIQNGDSALKELILPKNNINPNPWWDWKKTISTKTSDFNYIKIISEKNYFFFINIFN